MTTLANGARLYPTNHDMSAAAVKNYQDKGQEGPDSQTGAGPRKPSLETGAHLFLSISPIFKQMGYH